MSRLSLDCVTLCAIDTRTPELAARSLLRSMAQCDFARVVLFSGANAALAPMPGVDFVPIEIIKSGADYSRFVLRELPNHIATSHVLVTQWDGFVLHPQAWTDDFLRCDYVGAPWPDQAPEQAVGNGGFSLRSRRFLQAGMDPRIAQEHPEDKVMCQQYRPFLQDVHGIRFAPAELAQRFAYENVKPLAPSFGFHGPYRLPGVLDEASMQEVVTSLPDEFFRSRDARRMARALLTAGMAAPATRLLARRRAAGRHDVNTRVLAAASGLMQHLQRWTR